MKTMLEFNWRESATEAPVRMFEAEVLGHVAVVMRAGNGSWSFRVDKYGERNIETKSEAIKKAEMAIAAKVEERYKLASSEMALFERYFAQKSVMHVRRTAVANLLEGCHDYAELNGDTEVQLLEKDEVVEALLQSVLMVNIGGKPPKACPRCLGAELRWHCGQRNTSGVVDGRLKMGDVSTEFFLGCEGCSETIHVLSGDVIAQMLTEQLQGR